MERRSEQRRTSRRPLVWLAGICAIIMLCGAFLTVTAFRAPLETERTEIGTAVSQRGKYSWTASLYPNHLYNGRRVSDETAIFTNITRALNMEFNYQMSAAGATELRGTYTVDLIIRAGQNWSKRVPLVSPRRFTAKGDTATFWTQFTLDIPWLTGLVDDIEHETGLAGGDYTLVIQPSVATTVAGTQTSDETFGAPLELVWSDNRRQITMPAQREFLTETNTPVVVKTPGVVPVFNRRLPVRPTRTWSGSATGCAAVLTLWLSILARRASVQTAIQEQRLRKANGRLFIEGRADLPPALPTVELRDLEQVVKVARETGKPIVHVGNAHYVVDSGVVYLCGEAANSAPRPLPALVPRRQRKDSAAEV